MAINNFKPFATAANANVTAQADWETLPALLSGFMAGKASSAQVNKAIRQASFIAAALAQYTANKSGLDVLDDGDLNGFVSKMGTAFGKDFQALDATLTALAGLETGADKLPYFTGKDTAAQTDLTSVGRDIIGKSTIADILTYLHLEETVKLAANAFQVKESALTIDLNTLYDFSSAGVYFQSLDENATSEHHYPIKEAGTLLVTPSAYGCQQEYTAFGSGRKFVRGLETTGGPWKSWTEFYGTNHKPTPADIGALASNAVAVAAAKLSVARLINGVSFDGSKDINLPLLGHGQSWVDVTSQRSVGVTYTNTTGKPIQLLLDFIRPTTSWVLNIVVDGLTPSGAGGYCPVIPPGSTYRVNVSGITTFTWRELR